MFRGRGTAISAAVAVAAATVVAGCGGGSSSHALALDPVAAAATKTQNAGAARIRFSMALSGPRGEAFRMRGVGVVDGTSSEMSLRLGSMLGQMKIPAAAMKKLMHGSIKEIALQQNGDFVIYMRLGFLSSQIPGGKQWIELDVSKLGKSAGLDFSKLFSGSQFEPSDLLSMLRGEGATIHKLGPATVDGSATTHYRVTVDLAKALQAKGLTSPLLSTAVAGMKTASDDVYIGKDGLVRRIRIAYGMGESGRSVHVVMTMDLSDYGANVKIAAPPSSEVFDGTQLAQQRIGSSLLP